MLVKKGGDTRRYRDALLKDKCVFAVEDAIADFGMEHGVCCQALMVYVIGALRARFDERDEAGGFPYYPSEDNDEVDWLDGGDESEDEDGDGDSGEDKDGNSNLSDK